MVVTQESSLVRESTIGVDYAAQAMYIACVRGSKVNRTTVLQVPNPVTSSFLEMLNITLGRMIIDFFPVTVEMWIEQPWVSGVAFPLNGIKLSRTATLLEQAAVRTHLIPNFVHPGTWRKDIYGHGKPADLKELAVETVKERFGYDVPVMGTTGRGRTPDHNIAEAILIASYGNKRSKSLTGVEG